MSDDIALLKDYAETQSETAFAELVSRYLNLVYSVALRSTDNSHAAQEISQAVFIILARKAGSLSQHTALSGWLYQTARLTALNYLRTEMRRQNREQEAFMQSTLTETDPDLWPQIAPLLDDAMGRLGTADRSAIVQRFFENKSLRDVGAAPGANEVAARMRVNRALEKLRIFLRVAA
jgi:RNA polymerase sigma factor (sigma-70 family)